MNLMTSNPLPCYGERNLLVVLLSLLLVVLLLLRLLLGLLLVALGLEDGGGDTVKVTHAILRDLAAAVGVGLKDTDLLERLDNVALDTGGRVAVVAGADTTTVLGAVELGEGANTDVLAEVDVTGNGRCEGSVESSRRPQFREERRGEGEQVPFSRAPFSQDSRLLTGADVVPVGVVRSKLLLATGLDNVDPGGDLELTRALEVGRVGRDKVLSRDVAHARHFL